MPPSSVQISRVKCRGLEFTYRHAGLEQSGDAILFLHGFPQNSAMWTELMTDLAAQGYRCLAPDLRGYSEGARPRQRKAYALAELLADTMALVEHFQWQRFHLVGHDWGACLGWQLTEAHPARILSWTALSIPHMRSFVEALEQDPEQKKRSSYMRLFRTPWLPEFLLTRKRCQALRAMWRKIPEVRVQEYLKTVGHYAGIKAALNWYRANAMAELAVGPITVPTLYIVGERENVVGKAAIAGAAAYMQGPYETIVCPGSHWIVDESLAAIREPILRHIQRFGEQANANANANAEAGAKARASDASRRGMEEASAKRAPAS